MDSKIQELIDQAESLLRVAEDRAEDLGEPIALRVMRRRYMVNFQDVIGQEYDSMFIVEARDALTAVRKAWHQRQIDVNYMDDYNLDEDVGVFIEPMDLMTKSVSPERHENGEDWLNGWFDAELALAGRLPELVPDWDNKTQRKTDAG